MFRWWRDIGEQPCVWSDFGLWFIGCNVEHLHEVLSLGRLQALQQLHWVPCVRYDPDLPILDSIAENHPGIRKISLDMDLLFYGFVRHEPGFAWDAMAKLAIELVKFCVVDLTHSVCSTTFLRALLKASLSCGANSNLKTIKISGNEKDHPDVLAEARLQGVEITFMPPTHDAALKQPLDIIQIDEDGEEDRGGHKDEDVEKVGGFGKEGYKEGDMEEDEDGYINKHNEDDGGENPFDLISLCLHRSSAHNEWRIVKVEEGGNLRVTITAPTMTLTLPRINWQLAPRPTRL